eukprot:gene42218-2934_t
MLGSAALAAAPRGAVPRLCALMRAERAAKAREKGLACAALSAVPLEI